MFRSVYKIFLLRMRKIKLLSDSLKKEYVR